VNDTRSLTQVLQETKGTNTLSYVAGLSQFDPSQSGNAQWAYFHSDHQNNRVLTDGGGLVSKRWEYDPFGVVRSETGSGSSDFGYAGEQKDGETGLINLRARYYDPAIARFMSRDALGGTVGFPQSYNRFAYSVNNPLRYVDPSGYEHCAVDDEGNPVYCHPDPNDAEENDDEWEAQQEENNQEIVEYCIQGVLQCERISESHAADVLEDYADRRDNPGEDLEPDDDPDCTQPGNPRMCGMPTPVCFGGKCFLVFGIAKDILGGGGGGDAAEKATLAISKGRAIQAAGAAREARFLKQLAEQGVEGEILTQRYLRRADKSIITDTATGESRRLDVVVVKNGEVVAIYEVASPKANKLGQTQKTQRIISDNDGAYVLDPKTSELVWVPPKIKETVVRVP
jgi:RHS repeat-associated protein